MKKALLIWAVLGFVCVHAMDVSQARNQLVGWMKDFMQKSKTNYYYEIFSNTDERPYRAHGKSYNFLYVSARTYWPGKEHTQSVCVGVLLEGRLYKGFCLEGLGKLAYIGLYDDEVTFTFIKRITTPTSSKKSPTDLTFKLIDGTFYLSGFVQDQKAIYERSNAREFAMTDISNALLERLLYEKTQDDTHASTTTYAQNVNLGGQRYTLINKITTKGKISSCLSIMKNNRVLRGNFCMDGVGKADFVYKKNYLTLEFSGPIPNGFRRKFYLTFRVVDGVFYLHQYSVQNFKFNPDGSKKILKTQIIYRQSRDDPNGEKPITIDSLDSNYQAKLRARCEERGYCM